MEEYISKLNQINKQELSEREFYEKVLEVIAEMRHVTLTPETAEQLKSTLEKIGCMRYPEWEKEMERKGEEVVDYGMGEGIDRGDIGAAVSCIHQLLSEYKTADFGLAYMLDGGKDSWVNTWLENSYIISQLENSYIISQNIQEDIARLSDEEKSQVEQALEHEVDTLAEQRDELQQKNSIVQRIADLADKRKEIKEEISIEEQKKSKNLREFDD